MIINITIPTANIVERIEHNQASKGSNEINPPIIKITPKHPVIEFSLFSLLFAFNIRYPIRSAIIPITRPFHTSSPDGNPKNGASGS